jgi:hypothetical protein
MARGDHDRQRMVPLDAATLAALDEWASCRGGNVTTDDGRMPLVSLTSQQRNSR